MVLLASFTPTLVAATIAAVGGICSAGIVAFTVSRARSYDQLLDDVEDRVRKLMDDLRNDLRRELDHARFYKDRR